MKAWIFLLLLIIVVLKLCSKKSDYAPGIDPDGSNFAVYLGLGYDVSSLGGFAVYWSTETGGPYHKLAASAMWTKSREEVNNTIWTASTLSLNDGTTISNPSTTVWGFHKELQAGGGGKLFYLLNTLPSGDISSIQAGSAGSTMTPAPTLTEYTDCISNILYEIPQYVICQTSAVTSVLTCSTNAILTTPQGPDGTGGVCTCNAGYYGNGITCQLCPVGSYCTGGATASTCPPDSARGGANVQTTVGQGSTTVNACYNSCSAQAVLSGGSTTTAGSCLCPVGYASSTSAGLAANGAICTPCPAGTAQTSSPVVNVTSCPSCSPGYYTSTSGNTSCTQCPAGYSTNNGYTTCTSCSAGYYAGAGSLTCTSCSTGYYQANTGQNSCNLCGSGSSTNGGITSCTSCSPGYYQPNTGQTSCNTCPAGSSTNGGTISCIQCTTGYYSTVPSSTCSQCPSGSTSSSPFTSCISSTNYPITFTSTTSGNIPPTSAQVSTSTSGSAPNYGVSSGIIRWIVPVSRNYTFNLTGGGGGGGVSYSGYNAQNITMSMYIAANTPVYMIIGHGGQAGTTAFTSGGGGGGTFVFVTNGTSTNQSPPLNLSSNVVAVIAAAGGRGGYNTSGIIGYTSASLVTNTTFTNTTMNTVINKYQTSATNCSATTANGGYTGTAGGIYGLNCGAFGNFTNGSFSGSSGYSGGWGGFGGGAGGNSDTYGGGPAAGLCAQPPIVSQKINGGTTEILALSGYGFPMSGVPSSGTTGYQGSATVTLVSSGTAGVAGATGSNGANGQIVIS